jgi:hypothetical protein
MNANDSAFLATLRDEFNAQPQAERFRTGRFMTYEAVMELLRERDHAAAAVKRIDTRVHILLEAERTRGVLAAQTLAETERFQHEVAKAICPRCKVDRFKKPCPGPLSACPMVGEAQSNAGGEGASNG